MRDRVHSVRTLGAAMLALAAVCAGCGIAGTAARAPPPPIGARAALIRIEDLPAGWVDGGPIDRVRCPAANPWRRARIHVTTRRFLRDNSLIQQSIGVFRDVAAAREMLEVLASAPAQRCFFRALAHELSASVNGAIVRDPKFIREDDTLPETVAKRTEMVMEKGLGPTPVFIDELRTHAGRAVAVTVAVQAGEPIGESVYKTIVSRTLARLGRVVR